MGVDAQSTFCFLLSPEQHCDADTWGIRLLELVDQGFAPEANVADFGLDVPGTRKLYLKFPAAVIFSMRCTPSGRWSATLRNGLMKPSTPDQAAQATHPRTSLSRQEDPGFASETRVRPVG